MTVTGTIFFGCVLLVLWTIKENSRYDLDYSISLTTNVAGAMLYFYTVCIMFHPCCSWRLIRCKAKNPDSDTILDLVTLITPWAYLHGVNTSITALYRLTTVLLSRLLLNLREAAYKSRSSRYRSSQDHPSSASFARAIHTLSNPDDYTLAYCDSEEDAEFNVGDIEHQELSSDDVAPAARAECA